MFLIDDLHNLVKEALVNLAKPYETNTDLEAVRKYHGSREDDDSRRGLDRDCPDNSKVRGHWYVDEDGYISKTPPESPNSQKTFEDSPESERHSTHEVQSDLSNFCSGFDEGGPSNRESANDPSDSSEQSSLSDFSGD
ncbi:MAG: hypothetical protein LHV68_09965 [Elusimicrobia bacterium]|nr:hypothetical protein [Candidatus Liberimonas magnetica]